MKVVADFFKLKDSQAEEDITKWKTLSISYREFEALSKEEKVIHSTKSSQLFKTTRDEVMKRNIPGISLPVKYLDEFLCKYGDIAYFLHKH